MNDLERRTDVFAAPLVHYRREAPHLDLILAPKPSMKGGLNNWLVSIVGHLDDKTLVDRHVLVDGGRGVPRDVLDLVSRTIRGNTPAAFQLVERLTAENTGVSREQ